MHHVLFGYATVRIQSGCDIRRDVDRPGKLRIGYLCSVEPGTIQLGFSEVCAG
jgi:hypothetical protein